MTPWNLILSHCHNINALRNVVLRAIKKKKNYDNNNNNNNNNNWGHGVQTALRFSMDSLRKFIQSLVIGERGINCTRDFLLRSKEEMLPAFNAVFLMAVLMLMFLFNVC